MLVLPHQRNMEDPNNSASPKTSSHSTLHSAARRVVRCIQPQQSFRLLSESKGHLQERVHDKSKATQKTPSKPQTKPLEIKLHTQQRAARRAGFDDMVAIKINLLEQQRQLEEKLQKIIEEEEIRMLRKEMVPRAQLMPLFDRPFCPQRGTEKLDLADAFLRPFPASGKDLLHPKQSTRPLTVPREPSFHIMNGKCWCRICCNEPYGFHKLKSKL